MKLAELEDGTFYKAVDNSGNPAVYYNGRVYGFSSLEPLEDLKDVMVDGGFLPYIECEVENLDLNVVEWEEW